LWCNSIKRWFGIEFEFGKEQNLKKKKYFCSIGRKKSVNSFKSWGLWMYQGRDHDTIQLTVWCPPEISFKPHTWTHFELTELKFWSVDWSDRSIHINDILYGLYIADIPIRIIQSRVLFIFYQISLFLLFDSACVSVQTSTSTGLNYRALLCGINDWYSNI